MTEGQVYRCQNRNYGCEIKIIKPSTESNSNARCSSGAESETPGSSESLSKWPTLLLLSCGIENMEETMEEQELGHEPTGGTRRLARLEGGIA